MGEFAGGFAAHDSRCGEGDRAMSRQGWCAFYVKHHRGGASRPRSTGNAIREDGRAEDSRPSATGAQRRDAMGRRVSALGLACLARQDVRVTGQYQMHLHL